MSFKCSFLEQSKLHIYDNLFCLLLKGYNQTTYNQFLDVRSKGKQNQETSHPHVSQVKLLQLLQVAILVHHGHHGVLQSVQPLLQTHHLVLQALDVLVLERLLDPSVAVSRAAVNIQPQIL